MYTLKKLIKNPGKTAREFIDGNRINHYKPLLLTFVISGISAFISFKVVGMGKIVNDYFSTQHMNSPFMNDYMIVMSTYNSFIMLLCIPIFAFITWLAFSKWKNNYYEHVVMNAYILTTQTIVMMAIVSPVLFFLRHSPHYFTQVTSSSLLITPIILVWFFRGFYADKPLKQILLRILAVVGLSIVAFFVLIILVMIVSFVYAMLKGPEAMQYFLPPGTKMK